MIGGVGIGVAVEAACDQYARVGTAGGWVTDFVEYGVHTAVGIPDWVIETRSALGCGLTLHPLDMNMAGPEQGTGEWVESLAALVRAHEVSALVSDAGFWYHGSRRGTWFRPPDMNRAAARCRESAAAIAAACGVPFRVENPPLEWLPDAPSLWSFLDEASDHEGVQICLDLSHVLQFERNVHGRAPVLPRSFPWERVAEIHLAGYVRAEYAGRTVYLDQHLADIPAEEYRLLAQVVDLRGTDLPLGICLEMEPREPGAFVAAVDNIHAALGVAAA
ncbi:DUF692 family multinuclear iron-containing protein [Streptomyces sp. NPDC004267]|uniref:multinuclear nonheme iron-dependent oxidase n=1 Tax=Streptomyces sp. NPDC004267 TaxID=3364694 RepID=UPI00367B5154